MGVSCHCDVDGTSGGQYVLTKIDISKRVDIMLISTAFQEGGLFMQVGVKDAVKAMLKTADMASAQETKQAANEAQRLTDRVDRLRQFKKDLLGIERDSGVVAIDQEIKRLSEERSRTQSAYLGKYPSLSLEPLTWRNKEEWPRLAIFSLDSNSFVLRARGRYDSWSGRYSFSTSYQPNLPKALKECYGDVLTTLKKKARKAGRSFALRAEFQGLIPSETRKKIEEARKSFGNNIFVISEVQQWDLRQKAIPRPADPLVVGFDEKSQTLWLIDSFDLTSLENYIRQEFAV